MLKWDLFTKYTALDFFFNICQSFYPTLTLFYDVIDGSMLNWFIQRLEKRSSFVTYMVFCKLDISQICPWWFFCSNLHKVKHDHMVPKHKIHSLDPYKWYKDLCLLQSLLSYLHFAIVISNLQAMLIQHGSTILFPTDVRPAFLPRRRRLSLPQHLHF